MVTLKRPCSLSQGLGHSSELPRGYLYDSEDQPSQELSSVVRWDVAAPGVPPICHRFDLSICILA